MSDETSPATLPEGWIKKELGDVCLKVSKIDPLDLKREIFKYVDIGSIDSATNSVASPQTLSVKDAPGRARQLVNEGDTVFSTVRPYLKNIAYINESLDGEIASTGFCVIRANPKIVSKGLIKFFSISDNLLEQILPLQRGVSYPAVRDKDLFSASILVPPLLEQQKIVEILEEQLSRLDAALASVRAVREKSARFRRSLLHAAFSGALTGHDTSDGKLPKEWEEVEVGKLGHWLTGSTPSSKKLGCFGDSYPFVTPGDINAWGKLTKTARGLSDIGWKEVRVVSPPSVLLVCIGTIGKVSWSDIEVATNQQINALSIDADRHEPRFISLLFSSSSFQELLWDNSSSTTVSIINKGTLSKLVVSVPPLGEQKKIVEILEEQLSRLDASLAIADVVEKTASALRRSLLHAAFSGKLTKEWREGANV